MQTQFNARVTSLTAAISTAQFVGTWERDPTNDFVILDEGAAALIAGDRDLSGRQIPLSTALQCLHPADYKWVLPKIDTISHEGGSFIADYRVQTCCGVKHLLDRGCIERQDDGRLYGFGILLDITDAASSDTLRGIDHFSPPEIDWASALDALEGRFARSSTRAKILLEMLRIEIKRSSNCP